MSFVSSSGNGNTSSSVVVTAPSGIQDGDILVCFVAAYKLGDNPPITLPSGFTEWYERELTEYNAAIGWKRADSESGNYTVSATGATSMYAGICVYRGRVASGDPLDVGSNTAYTTNDTNVRADGVTITEEGADLIYAGWVYNGSADPGLAVPSGMNSRIATGYDYTGIAMGDLLDRSTGATGNKDGTHDSPNSSNYKHAFLVALTPADTGATGSGAVQTAAVAASGSGTVSHSGSGAVETSAAEVSGSGAVAYSGSGAVETSAAEIAGTGTVVGVGTTGSGAVETAPAALDGSGSVAYSGSGAVQTAAAHISGAGTVDTGADVSRVRIRAVDGYSKASSWVVSPVFTVTENAYPTIAHVDLEDGDTLTGNEPYLYFDVDDADADDLHVEVKLSVRPDFVGAIIVNSSDDQTDFYEAADPYESWSAVPEGGATAGNRVRWQAPALRYDWYYLTARVTDGILTSAWMTTIRVLVTPSGAVPLSCTIGETSYYIKSPVAYEKTGGEPSPLEFDIALPDYREDEVVRGASVSVGLVLGDYSRTWNGTVEQVTNVGALVHVYCLQDDSAFSWCLMTGDLTSDDLGANLADMIDTYGGSLDSSEMDTTLGVSAAITGDYKPIRSLLQEWAEILGYLWWADSTASVHLIMEADMADADYILHEEYPS